MKKILVLGDSHSLVWKYIQKNRLMPGYKFYTKAVHGATSQGVNNPNSKTNSLHLFEQAIQNNQNLDYVMVMLGEVDCGFTIWYYAENYNTPIKEQLQRSVSSYKKFLNEQILKYYKKEQVILLGSILPTIQDQTNRKLLKGARSKVNTLLSERTALTIEYNNMIKEIARQNKMLYTDITSIIYDNNTKSVKKEFLHKKEFNHHLDNAASAPVWINALSSIIK